MREARVMRECKRDERMNISTPLYTFSDTPTVQFVMHAPCEHREYNALRVGGCLLSGDSCQLCRG